jgi:hypothetical protein
MWNKDDLKQYQVLGSNLQSIMGGFGSFTLIASKFLLSEGIGTADETMMAQFEPQQWYPLDRFLRVFDRIHAEFGNYTLRQVGIHVPKTAALPPQVSDIHAAFGFMDAVYHLNHGFKNQPMFNPATGEIAEGIGHYKFVPVPGANLIKVDVDVPYPCPFDEGLVIALAQRFKPAATITHDKASCRSRGGNNCVYHVTWK